MNLFFDPGVAAQQLARANPQPDITAQANVPTFPFTEPATDLQREAGRLHAELVRFAAAHSERVQDVRNDGKAVNVTKAALDAEIARGAREANPNATLEAELALAWERAKAKATPEFHEPRVQLAYGAYIEALEAYEVFLRDHVDELVEELRPEAEAVAAEWHRANEKARKLLSPVEERHRELHQRVEALTSYQRTIRRSLVPEGNVGFHPSHWEQIRLLDVAPDGFGTPPIPSPEAVASYVGYTRPAPVQPVESDEEAA